MITPIFSLAICLIVAVLTTAAPTYVNIGIFGDKYNQDGSVSTSGVQAIAGMVLAIREINNKRDGMYDNLLSGYNLRFALRQTQGDYLVGLVSSQDFSNKVFNGSGVVGVVGTGYDESSRAMGQLYAKTTFKVNNVDYNSHGSDLSHGAKYPYFVRTCDSDAYDSRVIARLAKNYGWNRVTVIATSDTYGSDSLQEFTSEASAQDIDIENTVTFWSGTPDLSDVVNKVKSYGVLKVFVLLMKSMDAGNLLTAGYKAGLFKIETQIIGTRYVVDTSTWETYMSLDAPVKDILHGMIGVKPYLDRTTPDFQAFLQRFLAQNSTQYTKVRNGVKRIVCRNDTDDDGKTYLYVDNPKQSSPNCAGLDIRQMSKNGTGVMDIAAYAYDAVVALAMGLHQSLPPNNVTKFSGSSLDTALVTKVSFQGATGKIDFFPGYGGDENYGQGDRQVGLTYQVVNFNRDYNLNNAVRLIGTWDVDSNQYTTCDPLANTLCSAVVYNTVDGKVLDDTPDIVEVQLSQYVRMMLLIGGFAAVTVAIVFLVVVLVYGNTRLLKSSQPSIMVVIIFGGLLGGLQAVVSTMDITDATCIMTMWFGHFAFAFVYVALLVKVWRIGTIMKSGFSRVKITRADMYKIIGVSMTLFSVFLAIDTIVGKPRRMYEESFDGHNLVRLIKCDTENRATSFFLFALEGVMLFYGAKLSWDAKDAPGAVNESTSISLSIYFLLFVCAIIFPIVFLSIDPSPQNLTMIVETGFIVGTIGVLVIIFSYRTKLALEGADVDDTFQVVKVAPNADADGAASGGNSGLRRSTESAVGSRTSTNKMKRLRDKIRQRVGGSGGSSNNASVGNGYGSRVASEHKGRAPQNKPLSRPPAHSAHESNAGSGRVAHGDGDDRKSGIDGNNISKQRSGENRGSQDIPQRASSVAGSRANEGERETPCEVTQTNYFLSLKTLYFGSSSPAVKRGSSQPEVPPTESTSAPLNPRLPSVHEREEH